MIGSLRGTVGGRTGSSVVIDVNGVGYIAQVSALTMMSLGEVGSEASLLVHTQVREDAITLFGFREGDERDAFLMLVGVPKVGPKVALSLLSVMDPIELLAAIAGDDGDSLCKANGVGPKLASRLCVELHDKAVAAGAPAQKAVHVRGGEGSAGWDDAKQALTRLGYSAKEANTMIADARAQPNAPGDTASILSVCLRAANAKAA